MIGIGYLVIVNLVSFIMFGVDKQKAIHHEWRISEAALMISAAIGGGVGALCGMYVFHHKTKHPKFMIGVPLLLALWIAAICMFLFKFGR